MSNQKKLKPIALIIAINALVLYGLYIDTNTDANLNKVGGATVTNIQNVTTKETGPQAFTPVAAVVTRVLVATVYNALVGSDTQPNKAPNSNYLATIEEYQKYRLSQLDK